MSYTHHDYSIILIIQYIYSIQKHAEHLRQYTEDVRDRRRETGHMRQETKRQVTLDTRHETGDMAGDVRQET